MKKSLYLLLVPAIALTLTACGGSGGQASSTPTPIDTPLPSPTTEVEQFTETPQTSPAPSPKEDDRGIPGMKASTIRLLLDSSFGVPWTDNKPAPDAAMNIYDSSCSSTGSNDDNVIYDYSITMDKDEEIISASFGVSSTSGSTAESLFYAADLYFYALAIMPYDTANEDTVVTWFEETLPNATTDGDSISVGDATFTLYGSPYSMYWVDISKAE